MTDHGGGPVQAYTVRLELADEPGELLRALEPIAENGGNFLSVFHERGSLTPRGNIPVEVDFECHPNRFETIVSALRTASINVIQRRRGAIRRGGHGHPHRAHRRHRRSDTLSRITAESNASVADISLSAPEGTGDVSSARLRLATGPADSATFSTPSGTVADEKELRRHRTADRGERPHETRRRSGGCGRSVGRRTRGGVRPRRHRARGLDERRRRPRRNRRRDGARPERARRNRRRRGPARTSWKATTTCSSRRRRRRSATPNPASPTSERARSRPTRRAGEQGSGRRALRRPARARTRERGQRPVRGDRRRRDSRPLDHRRPRDRTTSPPFAASSTGPQTSSSRGWPPKDSATNTSSRRPRTSAWPRPTPRSTWTVPTPH